MRDRLVGILYDFFFFFTNSIPFVNDNCNIVRLFECFEGFGGFESIDFDLISQLPKEHNIILVYML